ncbi:class IV adenylate cyclase [Chloroflexota bacterium]
MASNIHLESEVKFLLSDPQRIENRLLQLKGKLIQARTLEINYRLDSQNLHLSSENKVLRLRKDVSSWLTYKGPGSYQDGIGIREEIEIPIGDIQSAIKLLEAIGFQVEQIYEKFRTVYRWNDVYVMIDHLPIGDYVELEGNDLEQIKELAIHLGLNWDRHIRMGYLQIFNLFCRLSGRQIRDIRFDDNKLLTLSDLEKMDILPADICLNS